MTPRLLRSLYFRGRDLLPLSARRGLRRLLPVERIFGIRKETFASGRLPVFRPEDIPGRPDVLHLGGGWNAIAAESKERMRALARAGGRIFVADPAVDALTPVAPGVELFPCPVEDADPAGSPALRAIEELAESRTIVEAVVISGDPSWRDTAEETGKRHGWPVDDLFGGAVDTASAKERLRSLFPRASVIVVTYNNREFNRACLDSLLASTDWPNFELVFVDNASTDGTPAWLEERRLSCPVPMSVIANAENQGFAAAVNQGLAAATGELLCLLNNDTVVTRGWLSAQIAHLRSDPRLGLVGPSTNEIANEARVPVPYRALADLPTWAADFTRRNRGRRVELPMLAMFCVVFRRTLFDEIGPLDERFGIGMFEDDDYSRRVSEAGYAIACARDAFVHHRGRASFDKLGEERYLALYRENEKLYRAKWGSPPASRPQRGAIPEALARASSPVVFLPSIGWNVTLVQRPHHLARAIAAAGHAVVFCCGERPEEGVEGFLEIEPHLFLHGGPESDLRALASPVLWSVAYNVPDPAAWPGARIVYDAIDHLDVFPHPRRRLLRNHRRALESASTIFAVSRGLRDEIATARPDVVYLPNGVDAGRFRFPVQSPRESPRPRAVYVGALARWFDFALLREIAGRNPGWDFRLYGEVLDGAWERSGLAASANVDFRGPRPNTEVPRLLAEADVGIIPFRVSAETADVSPIKLYEYFAAGKPVVSTPMPEAAAFAETRIAASAEEWTSSLAAALASSRDTAFVSRLRELGRAHDWSARGQAILGTLLYSGNR